jgi:hypothetical protein
MHRVFAEAVAVLDHARTPLHYADLAELALERLGRSRSSVDWPRQIEDVREKLLLARRLGTAYVGAPHCLAVKQAWFGTDQLDLLNADSVLIPVDLLAVVDGVVEAWQREEHMLRKVRGSSDLRRMRALFKGFVVEAQVKPFFAAMWPNFYEAPDNEGRVTSSCAHDFKLRINGRLFLVDVFSRKLNGSYDPPQYKPRATLHLACDLEQDSVIWRGVAGRDEFVEGIHPVTLRSPLRMVVWLNSEHAGLPYHEIADAVALVGSARAAEHVAGGAR